MATTLEELQILITSETSGLKKELSNVKKELGNANREVQKSTNSISSSLKKLGVVFAGVFAVKKAIDFGKSAVQSFNGVSIEAAKLEQVMRNTMGATDAQIKSVKSLIQAQEGIGVVDWGVQLSGAQELGTYLSQAESLKTLMPTLNDMLAQQYGLDATSEAAVNIGGMIGKVMDGQLGALSRYGYSWDEAQEKVLKHGNELERAAMLAEVIGQSVGGMNEALAQTPQGQLKQLSFTLDAIKESIGSGIMSAIQAVMPYLNAMANTLLKAAQYFQMLMAAIFGTAQMSTAAAGAATSVADAQTEAGDAAAKAGKKAKGSVAGFDEINTLADKSGKDSGPAGGGAVGMPDLKMPEIDTETIPTAIQAMIDKVKGILGTIGKGASGYGAQIKEAFSGLGPALQPLINMKGPIMGSLREIGSTFGELSDNFLKPVADYILLDFVPSIVTSFTESFAPVFADVAIWAVDEFAKTFQNVTDTLSALWNGTWLPSLENVKAAYLEHFPAMAGAVQSLLDGTIKPFVDYFLNEFVLPISAAIQETLVPILTDVLVWALGEVAKTFEWAANLMNDIYITVIEPVFNLVKTIVLDTLEIVKGLWKKHGETLITNISDLFQGIRDLFQQLWDVILKPIIEPFLEMLTWLWDKHLKGLVEQVGDFVMKVVNGALEIFNKFILPLVSYLIDILGPGFVRVFNFIVDVVGSAIAMISDVLKGLIKALGGVVDFIVGVLTGNWGKAWNGIVDVFTGIVDLIGGIFKGVLNIVIDVINLAVQGVLDSINGLIQGAISMINAVPGVNIKIEPIKAPKIPKLAKGGITNGEMIATIGDNPGGREVVSPLNDLLGMMQSAVGTAVMSAMQMAQGSGQQQQSGDIVIQVGGVEIARAIRPFMQQENNRMGGSLITIG